MTDDQGDLGGGFDEEEFGQVGRDQIVAVPTEDSLEPAAMVRLVTRYVSPRLPTGARKVANCAFVHSPYLDVDRPHVDGGKIHHHLSRSQAHDPFGRVHVVATGLNEGVSTTVDCDDPETLHGWLAERGLIDRPTVWIEAADRRLVWYPNGMADEATSLAMDLPSTCSIDAASVELALAIFHDKVAKVPRSDPAFWHDARLRVPCADTEKVIQKALSIALDVHFHRDLVMREYKLSGSVVDFVIHQVGSGPPSPICALELKVLREKHHNAVAADAGPCGSSVNIDAVNDGIEQAAIARDELGTSLAYLAAYDMRAADDDAIMAQHEEKAGQLSVECRRYYMRNSKKNYRKAAIGKRLGTAGKAPGRTRRGR